MPVPIPRSSSSASPASSAPASSADEEEGSIDEAPDGEEEVVEVVEMLPNGYKTCGREGDCTSDDVSKPEGS